MIIKMGKSYYLLNEKEEVYSGYMDPHSFAFTPKNK
jgi:hypothetical protein